MAAAPKLEPIQSSPFRAAGATPNLLNILMRLGQSTLLGAIGGVVGTTTMSAAMLAAKRAGLVGRLPPERITQRAFFKGLRRRHKRTKNVTATLLHFAFGAVGGAGFGVLQQYLPRAVPRPLAGIAYGTMIWLVSYGGWIPALRLMPPVHRDRPDRPVVMVLAHWIYGATMATVVAQLARRITV